MLAAYDGSMPHPRSGSAFQDDQGKFVCVDADDAGPSATDCLYHFNSLGYRSEEFDSAARLKIFVSGCSYTFGLGVAQDQTWPGLLKEQLAGRLGVPFDQCNLQNFSQVGASNGYIARTIIRQCERVRPDLAIIAFTHRERAEYLAPGVTRNLGLWDLDYPEEWAAPAIRYFSLLNTESASLDLLKNMLMVQWAMVRRRIPYLMLWMNRTGIDEGPIGELPPLRELRGMIDPARLSPRCLLEPEINVDSNPVDRHPGPLSHANLALRLLETLDLSVPREFAGADPADAGRRRVLVLGGSCPLKTGEDPVCSGGPCTCRQMNLRHRFLDDAHDSPVAEAASNDRIVRTLLAECRREKPRFVFARFSDSRSLEHFRGQALIELDPTAPAGPTPESSTLAEAFRQFATDELYELYALRNILLAQEFLEAQHVPYILSIPPALRWRNMNVPGKHPVLRAYASLISPISLCNRDEDATDRREAPQPRRPTELTWEFVKRLKERLTKSRSEDPNTYPLW